VKEKDEEEEEESAGGRAAVCSLAESAVACRHPSVAFVGWLRGLVA
jgi:hypothetical protein